MKKILVLHGVNLNMFGERDPVQYGTVTLDEINLKLETLGKELGCVVEAFQANDEGAICGKIHDAHRQKVAAVLVNAGAWTHYSYALRDALSILTVPVLEIHMSNIHAREEFRRHSVIAPICRGQISGFGVQSYLLGLRAAAELLKEG